MPRSRRKESTAPSPGDDHEKGPTNKPKPKKEPYKNANRATYFRDEVTGEKYYQCPVCSKRLKGHLIVHMRIHENNQPFECGVCGKKFSQSCNLRTHLLAHKKAETVKGAIANEEATKKSNQDQAEPVSSSSSAVEKLLAFPPLSTFACAQCDMSFNSAEKLSGHMKWAHQYREGKQFICPFCNKVFKRMEYLHIHIKREIGENDDIGHKCKTCKRVFINKSNFKKHVSESECQPRAKRSYSYLECSQCEKHFETVGGLRRHFINNHKEMKDRAHKCGKCSMAFAIATLLKQHMVKHTGKRPFFCPLPLCDKRFKHQSSVKNHLKYVHVVPEGIE